MFNFCILAGGGVVLIMLLAWGLVKLRYILGQPVARPDLEDDQL